MSYTSLAVSLIAMSRDAFKLPPPMSDPAFTAAATTKQRVFPLHLSPIEIYMLADDQKDYPMSFVVQVQLSGQIKRNAFEAALEETLDRHPLLQSRIAIGKGGLPCWVHAPDQRPDLDWGADPTSMTCPRGEGLDLTSEIGLRVWVRQGEAGARVLLQIHHACCDGTGAYRFLGDLLASYGMRTTTVGKSPSLGVIDVTHLRSRNQRSRGAVDASPNRLRLLAFKGLGKLLVHLPAPIRPAASASRNGKQADEFPGFLYRSFDRSVHQQLRDAATRQGVSFNDLLLRDLFLTLELWNRRQRSVRRWPWSLWGRRWLRILMPTDLRGGADFEMPATNLSGCTFLTRSVRDCAVPEQLLQSIREETAAIKHKRSGAAFVDMIYVASKVRWLLPFALSRNLCLATAVLSNPADPSKRFTAQLPRRAGRVICGNLELEEITGVPPLRPKMRAAFSISQYDRRLTISLRCDPHTFRLEDTANLLELYISQLRRSADFAPSTGSKEGDRCVPSGIA